MKIFPVIAPLFSRWIDEVANIVANLLDRGAPPSTIELVEQDNGEFLLTATSKRVENSHLAARRFKIVNGQLEPPPSAEFRATLIGSRIELLLRPDRFVFRPLELPARAADFLDGIVRAQIDRLTPWTATDAAFGCSKPIESSADRLVVMVAATSLVFIKPFMRAIADYGARSIAIVTWLPEASPSASPIKVWEEQARRSGGIDRIRKALVAILASIAVAAGATTALSLIVGAILDSDRGELDHRLAIARAAVGGPSDAGSMVTLNAVERRKQTTLSTVMVLEILSDILPDQTYVTELRVEGNKLRLVGLTHDAPSLIGLIERSGRFTRATFFAPTTRSQNGTSERFHIEAIIHSIEASRS